MEKFHRFNSTRYSPNSFSTAGISRINSNNTSSNLVILPSIDPQSKILFEQLKKEIDKNLSIFVNGIPEKIGNFEQNFTKLSYFFRNPDSFSMINEYITKNITDFYQSSRAQILENPCPLVLIQQTNVILRSILFFTQIFVKWHSNDRNERSIQDKIHHTLRDCFRSDKKFFDTIIDIVIKGVNDERYGRIKTQSIKWPIDLLLSLGYENELITAFKKDSENYLQENPITSFNPATIINLVENKIQKECMIFDSYKKSFADKVKSNFRQIAYNMFITSSITEILTTIYEEKNSAAFNQLRFFVTNSDNEELKVLFKDTWMKQTTKELKVIYDKCDANFVEDIIKLKKFILECGIKPDIKDETDLLIKRMLNSMDELGMYLIARYVNHLVTSSTPKDFASKINPILEILKLFNDSTKFISFHHHFFAIRALKQFGTVSDNDKAFLSSMEIIYDNHKLVNFVGLQKDIDMYNSDYSKFEANAPYPIKFMVAIPLSWPAFPMDNIKVPDEVVKARELFKTMFKEEHPKAGLRWVSVLDEATFKYKGVLFTGPYVYLSVLECIAQKKELDESDIPKKYQIESIKALLKVGLITRMAKKYVLAKFKPQKKNYKLPSISSFNPKPPKKLTQSEQLIKKKPEVEMLTVRILKETSELTPDELFQRVYKNCQFNLERKEFDICLSSLFAFDCIAMDENNKISYVM